MGCRLPPSYLCPAQVGGGADFSFSLPLGFLLWGVFSWPRFDMAEPQPNNHSSDRGVQAFTPASRDLGIVVTRERGGWRLDAWRVSSHRPMIYVEWDQKRGFWPSGGFLSGVRFLTQTAEFLSLFKSLLQTLCPRTSNQLNPILLTALSEVSAVAYLLIHQHSE